MQETECLCYEAVTQSR